MSPVPIPQFCFFPFSFMPNDFTHSMCENNRKTFQWQNESFKHETVIFCSPPVPSHHPCYVFCVLRLPLNLHTLTSIGCFQCTALPAFSVTICKLPTKLLTLQVWTQKIPSKLILEIIFKLWVIDYSIFFLPSSISLFPSSLCPIMFCLCQLRFLFPLVLFWSRNHRESLDLFLRGVPRSPLL